MVKCYMCKKEVEDPIPMDEKMQFCDRCFRDFMWENLQLDLSEGLEESKRIIATLRYYFPKDEEKQKDLLAAVMEGVCRFGCEIPMDEAKKIFDKWGVGWVVSAEFLRFMFRKYADDKMIGGG